MARFLLVLAVRVRLKVVNREFTKKHCINIQLYKVWVKVNCAYNGVGRARLRDPCGRDIIAKKVPNCALQGLDPCSQADCQKIDSRPG